MIELEARLAGGQTIPPHKNSACPVRKGMSSKLKLVSQGPFTINCGFVSAW